jgi:hypothetical protein
MTSRSQLHLSTLRPCLHELFRGRTGLPALEDTQDRALVSYMRGPIIFILRFTAFMLSRMEMPLHGSIIYQKGWEVARYGSVWQDCFDKNKYESGFGPNISFSRLLFDAVDVRSLRVCRCRPCPRAQFDSCSQTYKAPPMSREN